MKKIPKPSELKSQQSNIFLSLSQSLVNGNVVGIYTDDPTSPMFLTSVEQILENGAGETIVVVKKIDLRGHLLDNNRIPLSKIKNVKSFKARYNHRFPATLSLIAKADGELNHKLRIRERAISSHDLLLLIIKIIDSGYKVKILSVPVKMKGKCYVQNLGESLDTIIVSSKLKDDETIELSLSHIDHIEFEFFFHFNGFSSRVFHVTRDPEEAS